MGSSRRTLRLSMRSLRASQMASATSAAVTDPYSRSPSPAWAGMVSTVLLSVAAMSLGLLGEAPLVCCALPRGA